ncbi:hypothetical protein VP01_5483g1, partial [Puccinia sorghi]
PQHVTSNKATVQTTDSINSIECQPLSRLLVPLQHPFSEGIKRSPYTEPDLILGLVLKTFQLIITYQKKISCLAFEVALGFRIGCTIEEQTHALLTSRTAFLMFASLIFFPTCMLRNWCEIHWFDRLQYWIDNLGQLANSFLLPSLTVSKIALTILLPPDNLQHKQKAALFKLAIQLELVSINQFWLPFNDEFNYQPRLLICTYRAYPSCIKPTRAFQKFMTSLIRHLRGKNFGQCLNHSIVQLGPCCVWTSELAQFLKAPAGVSHHILLKIWFCFM